jgi:hypothetical protein
VVTDQSVALDTLMFAPWRLACCTLCGTGVPVVPLPRCDRCGNKVEPFEGCWQCGDEATGRTLAMAFVLCHAHLCRRERTALWQVVDAKLCARYAFPVQHS